MECNGYDGNELETEKNNIHIDHFKYNIFHQVCYF